MKYLNFLESIYLLETNNIKCAQTFIINYKKDLKNYTQFPYVLKLSSSLLHKTEEKAVVTNICSKDQLVEGFEYLLNILKKNKLSGDVVLQKQIDGVELIIGISEDKQFGKTILFGQGGIFAETIDDTSLKVLPVNKKDIKDLISKTKVYNILKGSRGKKFNVKELEDLIFKISKLAVKENIKDLDINPLIINETGLYIVDVRVGL